MDNNQGKGFFPFRVLSNLFPELDESLTHDATWRELLRDAAKQVCAVHLGIFVEPYLSFVLDGSKTVESRFSVNKCAPWGRVFAGDILLMKASGGPIVGVGRIAHVWSYRLEPRTWKDIRKEFTISLRAQDPGFWASRSKASYATLMRMEDVRPLPNLPCHKRDRRGWVLLSERANSPLWDPS